MSEHPTERFSEYLDGGLSPADAAAISSHLAACPTCAGVVADLERIIAAARVLEDPPPAAELWPAIEARLTAAPRVVPPVRRSTVRRLSFTLPQLAAAAVALILLSVGATWFVRVSRQGPTVGPGTMAEGPGAAVETTLVADGGEEFDLTLDELERAFEAVRDSLDPETVRTVERNLALIDAAIDQTREALEADPYSVYLHTHLAETRQRKLDVLRNAATLIQTTT